MENSRKMTHKPNENDYTATINVATRIEFQVTKKFKQVREMDYSTGSRPTFKVMRRQMESDFGNWSSDIIERRAVEGCEEYAEFTSEEMAHVFCQALNNMTQHELVNLSIADRYKKTLSL